ncbi:glycosyltransferase family 2 protein [Sphaerisporangium sp. NPDC049002]|uniref:glycosyltransferase n=1 Tax=Sphaerisporangium sp. NPDC049002 TaxID=3155392 RepID=UPI0033EEAA84
MRVLSIAQGVAALVAGVRLARGRDRLPPLGRTTAPSVPSPAAQAAPVGRSISVVIPARNEEGRIAPCVTAALADPSVAEVIVVDDESTDGTARLAAGLGARVLAGEPLPDGWIGKQWALHQGLYAAASEIVVTLDADTRPRPGLFSALASALDGCDLLSLGPRFVCDGPAEQALHASFLATLVYRFGPIGSRVLPAPHRVVANGQCMAFRREAMLAADGFARVRGHMTDDVALARTLAGDGWAVRFLDAGDLLAVDMHESTADVWREWGRTLAMPDVTDPVRLAGDLAVVWLTTALPVLRLAVGRPTGLDLGLLATRLLLTGALRGSYTRPGLGVLLSPLLDPVTAVRLTQASLRPVRTWRGRTYPKRAKTGTYSKRTKAGTYSKRTKAGTYPERAKAGTYPERTSTGTGPNVRSGGPPEPPARNADR